MKNRVSINSIYNNIGLLFSNLLFIYFCFGCSTQPEVPKEENIISGNWRTLSCQSSACASPRHENSFVEVNDKFYLMGGRGIKPVDIFDPVDNTWSQGKEPPIELHHFQAVAYKDNIFVMGALTGNYPRETPLENIIIYDTKNDEWEIGAVVPAHRRRGAAGVVIEGNRALIISGIIDGHWDGHVPWVDEYNFDTGEWKELADAPRARDHFHAASNNGEIYCAGGRNSSAKTNQTFELTIPEVDVYNISNNTWASLPVELNLPTERAGASSVFLSDDLIVIGGESASQNTAHKEVEAYNLITKNWRVLDSLITGRHGTQAILHQNSIYIVAGSGNRGGSPELSSIEIFELSP